MSKDRKFAGIVISFEGTDGSGKTTQVGALMNTLKERGFKVRKYKFPTYTLTGSLAYAYLNNELGTEYHELNSESLNGYQAASLYLVDMICHAKVIKEAVDNGEVVIIDRYVGSNYYQQAVRSLEVTSHSFDMNLRNFIREIDQMAYNMMGIYKPDITFFMNVSPEFSKSIREKDATRTTKDFHEKNEDYLCEVAIAGLSAAKIANWKVIDCDYRSIDDISEEIASLFINEVKDYDKYYNFNFD